MFTSQHLRREIFSESQFGDQSAKFCRDFKVKFGQPDREFESYLLRQRVLRHKALRGISDLALTFALTLCSR